MWLWREEGQITFPVWILHTVPSSMFYSVCFQAVGWPADILGRYASFFDLA